jgi:beta-lactamase class A
MKRVTVLLFVLISYVNISFAVPVKGEQSMHDLKQTLIEISNTFPGKVGLYMHDFKTNQSIHINADEIFPMASTYKLPILIQLFRDKDAKLLSLNEKITLTKEQMVTGSGLLKNFIPGATLHLRDLAILMMAISDNTATDLILERVKIKRVDKMIQDLKLRPMRVDLTVRQSLAELDSDPEYDPLADLSDTTSPRAMGLLLEKLVKCELTSKASCEDIKHILSRQMNSARIPRILSDRNDVQFFHKTGTTNWVTNDVGIIKITDRPEIVLCIYTLKNSKSVPTHSAEEVIGALSRKIVETYS